MSKIKEHIYREHRIVPFLSINNNSYVFVFNEENKIETFFDNEDLKVAASQAKSYIDLKINLSRAGDIC